MNNIVPILGLGFLALTVWYLPWRVAELLGSKRALWPWRAFLLLLMGAYLVAMHYLIFATGSYVVARFYLIWAICFVFELYLFIFLAAFHLLSLTFRRPKFKPRLVLAAAVAFSAALTGYQLYRTQEYVIKEYVIPVPGLESKVRIMHFVDLHLGAFRGEPFLKNVVADIDELQPDLVIWNGDLASSNLALDNALFDLFKTVQAEQYFTTGNHEFDIDTNRLLSLLESSGIEFLRSRMVETHGIQLIGLEYMNGEPPGFSGSEAKMITELTIADVLPGINRVHGVPTVVFHHSPVGLRHAAMGDVDVMLTGNTHAGQQSPLTTMFRLNLPVFSSGQSNVGHMVLLVSSGGGDYVSWFRLGPSYEFQLIDLVPG